jgi:hypothetical protein
MRPRAKKIFVDHARKKGKVSYCDESFQLADSLIRIWPNLMNFVMRPFNSPTAFVESGRVC